MMVMMMASTPSLKASRRFLCMDKVTAGDVSISFRRSISSDIVCQRTKSMGVIYVTTTLRAREKARKKYVSEFLVDTGATDSLAPAKELKKAGIKRRGRMAYELADGQTVEYDFGLTEIEFLGELTSGRVILGPDNADPILGVTALESV